MNICLAVIFLVLNTVHPTLLFIMGTRVNSWLAIFNLIPMGPLDGTKIFRWNRKVWMIALAVCIGLFAVQYLAF